MFPRRLMLVLLVAAIGCARSTTGKSIDELRAALQGKDAKAVMSLMGKPTGVSESNGTNDEMWVYFAAARHPATGTPTTVTVSFRGGRVVKVEGL